MQYVRIAVAAILVGLAAPVAASIYALGSASIASPSTGIAAGVLLAVMVLSVGYAVSLRYRAGTPYW